MPSANEIYSGRFLNAAVVKSAGLEGKTLKIMKAEVEMVGQGENAKRKIVLSFNETEKVFAVNKINSGKLSKAYGDDYEEWIGEPIILKVKEVDFSGETVNAIRVEIPSTSPFIPNTLVYLDTGEPVEDDGMKRQRA